jgi:hypothetical protein
MPSAPAIAICCCCSVPKKPQNKLLPLLLVSLSLSPAHHVVPLSDTHNFKMRLTTERTMMENDVKILAKGLNINKLPMLKKGERKG